MDLILRPLDDTSSQELHIPWPKDLDISIAKFLCFQAKLAPQPICAGLGRCGLCWVRWNNNQSKVLAEEEEILSAAEIANGIRLACRHKMAELADQAQILEINPKLFKVNSDQQKSDLQSEQSPKAQKTSQPNPTRLSLAIDLGTTNICWAATDLASAKKIASGQFLNPQALAGSDVISRLSLALEDKTQAAYLALTVKTSLQKLIQSLPGQVENCVLVGNTIMTEIFLEKDLQSFRQPPYTPDYQGDDWVELDNFPKTYIPPLPGPFIGSDLASGLVSISKQNYAPPWLLADLGTNAEFALYASDKLYLTSVPLGPALEGIGMRCGGLASPTTATNFTLTPQGLLPKSLGQPCTKISATGYLNLLAQLLRLNILAPNGQFQTKSTSPLAQKISQNLQIAHGRTIFKINKDLFLDGFDIEEMLKVKAAFASAIHYLLQESGLEIKDLRNILLAGALGTYVDPKNLETLGFLPPGFQLVQAVGNSALDGAKILLAEPESKTWLKSTLEQAHLINLTAEPKFQETFLNNMSFGSQFCTK